MSKLLLGGGRSAVGEHTAGQQLADEKAYGWRFGTCGAGCSEDVPGFAYASSFQVSRKQSSWESICPPHPPTAYDLELAGICSCPARTVRKWLEVGWGRGNRTVYLVILTRRYCAGWGGRKMYDSFYNILAGKRSG